ncbi:PEP-CTERM sorting domain-containing protein [Oceaniferula spumae]
MTKLFTLTPALVLMASGLSGAAIVVPGHSPVSDGLFSYRIIDINGSGTDTQINTATEAKTIVSTIGSTAAPGIVGNYGFSANDTGTIGSVDNGSADRLYTVSQLTVSTYSGSDFVIQYTGGIYFPAGDYSIYVNGDDGHSISIPGVTFINRFGNVSGTPASDELLHDGPTGSSNQGAQFTVGPGGLVTTFEATWYERGGGDYFEVELRTGFGTKSTGANAEWDILRENADSSGIAINSTPFVVTAVPEPSSALLLALGSISLLGRRRR